MLQSTGHSFIGNASNTAFLNEAFKKESLSKAKWQNRHQDILSDLSPQSVKALEAQRKFTRILGSEPQAAPIGFGATLGVNPLEQTTYGRKKLLDTQFYDRSGVILFQEPKTDSIISPSRKLEPLSHKIIIEEENTSVVSSASLSPSKAPSIVPSAAPSAALSAALSAIPSAAPSTASNSPSKTPTVSPSKEVASKSQSPVGKLAPRTYSPSKRLSPVNGSSSSPTKLSQIRLSPNRTKSPTKQRLQSISPTKRSPSHWK